MLAYTKREILRNSKQIAFFLMLSWSGTVCTQEQNHEYIPVVDFVESMLCTAKYTCEGVRTGMTSDDLADWQAFANLYTTYIVTDRLYTKQPRIPKIIHHIWLGSPLPESAQRFIATWRQHNPGWLFILWDDARVAQLQLVNQTAYDAATNWGEKSDIARYEILYLFGGLYVDTDFECLQPFDALHHCCDFYTGAAVNSGGGVCTVFNGLLASTPQHPVLKRCIEGIRHEPLPGLTWADDIMHRTGPHHFTKCLKEAIAAGDPIGRCVPFPPTYFYPWPGAWRFNKNRDFIEQFIRPESLAIHHWANSWV